MSEFSRHACFNELSFEDFSQNHNVIHVFNEYIKTASALKESGFKKILYAEGLLNPMTVLGSKIQELKTSSFGRQIIQALLSSAKHPYIEPGSEEENRYIQEYYEVDVAGNWREGEGFSSAFINDTVTISLNTHDKWTKTLFDIRRKGKAENCGQVINIASKDTSDLPELRDFIAARKELILEKCTIAPEKKKKSFRKDHGIDKLTDVWNRIRHCEYVVSAINSLEWNSYGTKYIEKCLPDGIIYIRLIDSDKGYGMAIQTTGTDIRSTEAIGEILAEKFFL